VKTRAKKSWLHDSYMVILGDTTSFSFFLVTLKLMMTVKLLSSPGSVATRGGPGLPHGVKITVLHVRGAVPSCDAIRRWVAARRDFL
jgi:hypothetical protein